LWLVTSPAVATLVFAGPMNAPWPSAVAAIDDHGIWFDGGYAGATDRSIWLYSQNVIRMVAQPNLDYLSVAGGCLSSS
jgi:anti-sigma factor RsiW